MTKTQQQRRQQWQQWIAEYRTSGLSAREWCASRGVNPHRLWYWLRCFRTEEESGSTKWLLVDLRAAETEGRAEGGCLVVTVGKAAVEVQPGLDRGKESKHWEVPPLDRIHARGPRGFSIRTHMGFAQDGVDQIPIRALPLK